MTLAALFFSSLAMAQMPYNPDANGDNMVGSGDLLTFLTFYGSELIQSDLTCDYEGTVLESWVGGLFDGTLIFDSLYVEYLIIDTVSTFLPGCPDPVDIETVLERAYTLTNIYFVNQSDHDRWAGTEQYLGYTRSFDFRFYDYGEYRLRLDDREVEELTSFSSFSDWNGYSPDCCDSTVPLPFPNNWTLDENGIQVDWYPNHWIANCENFRLIPFWSVAE